MSNRNNKNPSLPKPGELHPLHPEIFENQATINLGTLGHVSHGKSTLVECLTGIKPLKQSVRNFPFHLISRPNLSEALPSDWAMQTLKCTSATNVLLQTVMLPSGVTFMALSIVNIATNR